MTGRSRESLETCALLANELRSLLLVALARQDGPVHVETLAEELAAQSGPTATPGGAAGGPTTVVELHHHHLPKLDAAGWIDYDPDEGIVRCVEDEAVLRDGLQNAIRELERIRSAYVESAQ